MFNLIGIGFTKRISFRATWFRAFGFIPAFVSENFITKNSKAITITEIYHTATSHGFLPLAGWKYEMTIPSCGTSVSKNMVIF